MGQSKTIAKSNRDAGLDIARAICALWVVGFWHLVCYVTPPYNIYIPVNQALTDIFMSCFMLISGYVLNRYTFDSLQDVRNFYHKRFVRFYILFMISSITLYVANIYMGSPMFHGIGHLLLNLTGLTTLFPPHAGMLWFMSMLMLFYLLTPFIQYKQEKVISKVIVILLSFILWYAVGFPIDKMVFVYFPIYAIGLLMPRTLFEKVRCSLLSLFVCMLLTSILIYISFMLEWGFVRVVCSTLSCLCGTMAIITISTYISKISTRLNYLFAIIAYGSMCAYLFHRHFYSIIDSTMGYFDVNVSIFTVLGIYLPIMLAGTYLIQKLYDYAMQCWQSDRKSQQLETVPKNSK